MSQLDSNLPAHDGGDAGLQAFTFEGTQVRTLLINGEPWWVSADVAGVLDIGRTHDAVRSLDEDEKGTESIRTPGGEQAVTVINEPGLYSLVLRSRKPQARKFKRWITHEVIPAIRRTGRYEAQPQREPSKLEIARDLVAALEAREAAEERAELAEEKVVALEPKAQAHDAFLSAEGGDRLVRQAAKELGWRERDLREWLLNQRLIYRRQRRCGGVEYDFYASHAPCFRAVETLVEHTWGTCSHYTLYLTPRGMSYVYMRMRQAA